MKLSLFLILSLSAAVLARAQTPLISLRIEDETIPAGETVQIKVKLTEPKPISGGKGSVRLPKALSLIRGISGFSVTGDLSGVAMPNGASLDIRCISPSSTWGAEMEYPILVVAADVNARALPGAQIPLNLIPQGSIFYAPDGQPYPQEISPGTLTVGGSLSISNVVPGGGPLRAGSVVQIFGSGFQPGSKLQVNEILTTNTRFISANEMGFTLAQDADLTGTRIRVDGDNGERIEYYSYLRPTWYAPSANPLLAQAIPIFPTRSYVNAYFAMPQATGVLAGLAILNPNASEAILSVQLFSSAKALIAQASVPVASRHAVARELSEWLGVHSGGAFVRVMSSPAVQLTGMKIDANHNLVSPLPASNAF